MLIGTSEGVYKCSLCGMTHFGYPRRGVCQAKGCHANVTKERTLEDNEKLPATQFCDDCKKEVAEHAEVVKGGGIYWKCKDCNSEGVIRAESELAIKVRKQAGIEPPDPVGFEWDKTWCPKCKGEV
jgi:rubrerythrin